MPQHLLAFIEAFVAKRYRQHWLHTLHKAKPSDNIVRGMDALWRELDERYCTILSKRNQTQQIAFIRQKLGQHKLTTGYILSANQELSQRLLPVEEALALVMGSSTTAIISFIPGQLAYFEGHSPSDRYLCVKGEVRK